MEKKINPEQVLVDLDNQPIMVGDKPITMGRAIALCILQDKSPDPLRAYILSQEYAKAIGELTIKESDREYVTSTVKNSTIFGALIKGPILLALQ